MANGSVHRGQPPLPVGTLLDEVITQIVRARRLILKDCRPATPGLDDERGLISSHLDAAISLLKATALEGLRTTRLADPPPLPFVHPAWSEAERRWISMTFYENQAWLARPDLDPVEFALHEGML
jgi:hypothetical protein